MADFHDADGFVDAMAKHAASRAVDVRDLIGGRVLVTVKDGGQFRGSVVDERRVLEVSPSGQWTRLMDQHGRKVWTRTAEIHLVEVLAVTTEPRPQEDGK